MSEKTKNTAWLPWTVSIAVVTTVGFICTYLEWDNYLGPPWDMAESIATAISLEIFQTGGFEDKVFWSRVLQALAGFLLLFVIGPSFWIYGEIKNQNEEDELKKGLLWYAGSAIVIFGLFIGIAGTVVEGIVFQNVWNSTEVNKNEDELRMQLMKLGFDAYQLYYLPAEMGGGDGSFQIAIEKGTMRPIQLDDLKHYSDSLSNSYVLKLPDSASTITIYGIGTQKSGDPNLKNVNGEKGMVQLAMDVLPGDEIIDMK